MTESTNSARILQELVSLESWHEPLQFGQKSKFHIALAFGDARYAGRDNFPIEFRVRLKRATLVVKCDPELRIPRATKVRAHPPMQKTVRQLQGLKNSTGTTDSITAEGQAAVSAKEGPSASAKVARKIENSSNKSHEGQNEVTEVLTQHIRMIYREVGDEHHWDCEPIAAETLKGHAHEGTSSLMELTPKVDKRLSDMGIRIMLKCKSDDFEITDITANKTVMERLRGDNLEKRLRMAREVIKEKLADAQLEVVELDPKFRDVIIADILSVPDVD